MAVDQGQPYDTPPPWESARTWFPAEYPDNSGRLAAHLPGYTLDLHRSDSDCLVVTFEAAGGVPDRSDRTRPGWAVSWLERQGFSILAVKALKADWYRKPELHAFLRTLQREGFFARFRRTVFYGSSMGGYAALAFSSLVPGSIVLAYSPQTSLHPALTPWDPRFKEARKEDWDGDFADAAACAEASRVIVVYDPLNLPDRMHVARLPVHNLLPLRFPAGGHLVVVRVGELNSLGHVFTQALDGSLTVEGFAKFARRRRELFHYWLILSKFARNWPMAQRCIDEAARLAPNNRAVQFYRAYAAHRWQRWDEAVPLLTAALERSPRDAFLHEALAESHARIAARYASAGLALRPGSRKLAQLLAGIGQRGWTDPWATLRAARSRAVRLLGEGGSLLAPWLIDSMGVLDLL